MVRLVIDKNGQQQVVPVSGWLTIGRQIDNDVLLPDESVASHHARIFGEGRYVYLEVLPEGGNVSVNGGWTSRSQWLAIGDIFQIGQTRMKLVSGEPSADGFQRPDASQTAAPDEHAIGRKEMTSSRAGTTNQNCGACHSPIVAGEESTLCPSCSLPFHLDCWQENLGCAAYGCSQVNALRTGPDIRINVDAKTPPPLPRRPPPVRPPTDDSIPWEYLGLAGSAVGALISTVSFGVPSFFVGIFSAIWFVNQNANGDAAKNSGSNSPGDKENATRSRTAIMTLVLIISIVGFLAGVVIGSKR